MKTEKDFKKPKIRKLIIASMLAVGIGVISSNSAYSKDIATPTLDTLHNSGTIIPNSTPATVYPQSAYSYTKVDTKGANTVTKFEYNAQTKAITPVFYRIDLKKSEYGSGDISTTTTIKAPTDDVTITAKYNTPQTSNPQTRIDNSNDSPSTNVNGNFTNLSDTSSGAAINNVNYGTNASL